MECSSKREGGGGGRGVMLKCLALTVLLLVSPSGASRSNAGTEFMLSFLDNTYSTGVDLEIFVTTMSNTPASVSVTTPTYNSGWSTAATVAKMTVELLLVPNALRNSATGPSTKVVYVTSTQEITVYCVNKERYTTDAYVGYPTHVVGDEYFAMTYGREAGILVVGITDNTAVTVKLSDNSRSGSGSSVSNVAISYGGTTYGNGQTMTFSVNRFQAWHVYQGGDYYSDLTGTYITASNPVSVISGNLRCSIPVGAGSSDHQTEMMPGVDVWGKEFISTSTPDRGIGDLFRIMAAEDGTTVTFGGGGSCSLSRAGDFCEKDWSTEDYKTISADKPILVAMFAKTWKSDGPNYGDPAMSLLIPTPQFAAEYTWSTTNLPDGNPFNDKISIIIEYSKRSGLMLDSGAVSTSDWKAISGTSTYRQKWMYVNPGSHNLYHTDPTVTFMALATGTERYNSYAFIAGTRMAQINIICVPTSTTPGDVVDNDCDGAVDEEANDGIDNDGDGQIDEDLALPPRIDGNWGNWGGWGTCSVTCGAIGTQDKVRLCDNPAPQNNGDDCAGSGTQTQNCDMRGTNCPVNGGFTNWSGWGSCSVTCGTGTQYNTRSCTNPAPAHGGAQCSGASSQQRSCNTGVSCAVHGNWGSWGSWAGCSVTCETGTWSRSRQCNNPAPANGGNQCAGSSTSSTSCNAGIMCPIDGGFSAWSSWAGCSVTCEQGTWGRSRSCTNPAPQHGGASCSGATSQTTQCDAGIMCPIDGSWGTWAPWAGCSVTCEIGTWSRQRTCSRPTPQYNGAQCPGVNSQTTSCDAGIMCPIDGMWGTWGPWGGCSVTCDGIGTKYRYRDCNRPAPQFNGADCVGSANSSTSCDYSHLMCPSGNPWQPLYFSRPTVAPVDGGVGQWGDWTMCSRVCGGGHRVRMRFCNSPIPMGTGQFCTEPLLEEEMCNMQNCTAGGYAHGVTFGGSCANQRGLFDCKDGIQCIPLDLKCDCRPHCADLSDEDQDYAGCVSSLDECASRAGISTPFTLFSLVTFIVSMLAFRAIYE